MFNKILVTLDGFPLAAKILPHMVDLGKTHDTEIALLHVYYSEVGEASPGAIREAVAQETKRCDVETYPTQAPEMKSLAEKLPLGRKSDQT